MVGIRENSILNKINCIIFRKINFIEINISEGLGNYIFKNSFKKVRIFCFFKNIENLIEIYKVIYKRN